MTTRSEQNIQEGLDLSATHISSQDYDNFKTEPYGQSRQSFSNPPHGPSLSSSISSFPSSQFSGLSSPPSKSETTQQLNCRRPRKRVKREEGTGEANLSMQASPIEKPEPVYECTWGCLGRGDMPRSYKTKQDWERHEWKVHVMYRAYYCMQDGCLDSPAFSDHKNLREHQKSTHPHHCDRRCSKFCQYVWLRETMHFQSWYPCVFCVMQLQSGEGLQQTWTCRQDHIADHFKSGCRMNNRAVRGQPSTELSPQGSLDSQWNSNDSTFGLRALVSPQQYSQPVPSSFTAPFVNPNELPSPYSSFFNHPHGYDSRN